jgi:hypothetical protein
MPHVEHGHIIETPIEARGGVLGKPVLYMLAFGTIGVIALFVVVYLFFFAGS